MTDNHLDFSKLPYVHPLGAEIGFFDWAGSAWEGREDAYRAVRVCTDKQIPYICISSPNDKNRRWFNVFTDFDPSWHGLNYKFNISESDVETITQYWGRADKHKSAYSIPPEVFYGIYSFIDAYEIAVALVLSVKKSPRAYTPALTSQVGILSQLQRERRIPIRPSVRFQIFKRDDYRCQICGRTSTDGSKLEVDHKYPVSRGGTDGKENLWVLCWECNRGKSDQLL